jgi:ribosomal protein S12 methylthiotransferase
LSDSNASSNVYSESSGSNSQDRPTNKVGFVSLGCPKALVDSENILTRLRLDGYEIVPSYTDADLVVVNTCGFIDSAKQESLDTIGEALKENGQVIVTGCLGADDALIRREHPQVLGVSGPQATDTVVSQVHQALPRFVDATAQPSQSAGAHDPFVDLVPPQGIKLTPAHYSYLKISEGCNHKCSFCIIPSMRGKLVSRDAVAVLAEAERLVAAGTRELLVISQDTSAYGVDIKYREGQFNGRPVKSSMLGLCEALAELGVWVRLHYVYPYPHVDQVIPLMAEGKLLPYLDIPFQHASLSVLKAMRRPAATENTLARIMAWREICPELTLRSTFIVGFPGETEDDFQQLLEFLEQAQLDRVGCFQYSPVQGAAANELQGAVPDAVKQERWERFMETQQRISARRLQQKIGQSTVILIDGCDDDYYIGRSSADAPEIDGQVFVSRDPQLDQQDPIMPGDMLEVRINDANEYDLFAELIYS